MKIMSGMGFDQRWQGWIFQCILSASISVLVNRAPTDRFWMAKGLRQGYPLSPLLFNLVGETFSQMLRKAEDIGLFEGIIVGNNESSISISHL